MEVLRRVFAFGKWALIGGGLYQVWSPEGLPASLALLSEIAVVVGIPCFFIFGAWLLCLNLGKLRNRGFIQAINDEWYNIKVRSGRKTKLMVWSMVFFCVALIPAYTSQEIIGQASVEAPLWVQAFVGVGLFGFVICIFMIIPGLRIGSDKD